MKKLFFLAFIAIFLITPFFGNVRAQDLPEDAPVEVNVQKTISADKNTYNLLAPLPGLSSVETTNIGKYFNTIFKIAIGLCGVLAVVMLIINGISYMMSESFTEKARLKEKIMGPIFGLLIAIGAFVILNTIDPALTGSGGLSVAGVEGFIDEEVELEQPDPVYTTGGGAPSGTGAKICEGGYVDVTTYGQPQKINICKTIAGIPMANNLQKMIDDAKKDGVILSGSGSRSYATQVQLRIRNKCADTYNASPSTCKPPTARPGRSNHEGGGAIDITCNGKKMMASGGRNSVCFKWLASNASKYNFKNLQSEPWHWSFNGK